MGKESTIAWTDATWNPWRGCTKVSAGCKNCYMFKGQERWGRDPSVVVKAAPATFNAPMKWKERKNIFTCSWSDFFHKDADAWRPDAWDIMRKTPRHTYQILTKRPERIKLSLIGPVPENVLFGTSVEDWKSNTERVPILRAVPNVVRFLSMEPLLEHPGEINLNGIDWVIVGGESGPGARPMDAEWAREIRDQCRFEGVAFFMKQMGGVRDKREDLASIPEDLRIREFPK